MSEPVVQRQAVPDPQEALREQMREVLSECRVSVHTAPWVEEVDGYVVRLELGRVNAEALADAVLPVVQAHTQALRAERNLVESLRSVEFIRHREQYDRVLAWALRDQQRAGKAEDALAALRDAVSRLADSDDDRIVDAIEKALDEAHGGSHYECCFNSGTFAYPSADAVKALVRSLLGDKENN